MIEKVHHIRLLAGLEIEPSQAFGRTLDRQQAEHLAAHLAADLSRVAPAVENAMLAVSGSLLEPAELLRPGFPAWAALEELAEATLRGGDFEPRVMAIGAHAGRMPHPDLQAPRRPPQGHFIALPMILTCPASQSRARREELEACLFERGSIDPPARACLGGSLGLQSVHGQLLTLADLMAIQHVQYDAAGLGGFWPVIEHALGESPDSRDLDLPGGLAARWQASPGQLDIDFISFDQAVDSGIDYPLWMRAFRTLTALLDSHGTTWHAIPRPPVVFDPQAEAMIEPAGRSDAPKGLTVHQHPDIGLLALSVVEDGRMVHIYPVNAAALERVMADLAQRGLGRLDDQRRVHVHPETGHLQVANP